MRAFGLSHLGKWFPALFSDFLLHEEPLPLEPNPVEAISGACMLVKREAVEDVGLWDEGYFLHCEDLEIGRAHVELQSLMRISYAVFCLKKKNTKFMSI